MESTHESSHSSREDQSIALLTKLNRELFGESVTVIDATGKSPRELERSDTTEAA